MNESLLVRDAEHRGVWYVRRGDGFLGCIIRQRNGKLEAFIHESVRHYVAEVGTVAAGVRWIARRAPR